MCQEKETSGKDKIHDKIFTIATSTNNRNTDDIFHANSTTNNTYADNPVYTTNIITNTSININTTITTGINTITNTISTNLPSVNDGCNTTHSQTIEILKSTALQKNIRNPEKILDLRDGLRSNSLNNFRENSTENTYLSYRVFLAHNTQIHNHHIPMTSMGKTSHPSRSLLATETFDFDQKQNAFIKYKNGNNNGDNETDKNKDCCGDGGNIDEDDVGCNSGNNKYKIADHAYNASYNGSENNIDGNCNTNSGINSFINTKENVNFTIQNNNTKIIVIDIDEEDDEDGSGGNDLAHNYISESRDGCLERRNEDFVKEQDRDNETSNLSGSKLNMNANYNTYMGNSYNNKKSHQNMNNNEENDECISNKTLYKKEESNYKNKKSNDYDHMLEADSKNKHNRKDNNNHNDNIGKIHMEDIIKNKSLCGKKDNNKTYGNFPSNGWVRAVKAYRTFMNINGKRINDGVEANTCNTSNNNNNKNNLNKSSSDEIINIGTTNNINGDHDSIGKKNTSKINNNYYTVNNGNNDNIEVNTNESYKSNKNCNIMNNHNNNKNSNTNSNNNKNSITNDTTSVEGGIELFIERGKYIKKNELSTNVNNNKNNFNNDKSIKNDICFNNRNNNNNSNINKNNNKKNTKLVQKFLTFKPLKNKSICDGDVDDDSSNHSNNNSFNEIYNNSNISINNRTNNNITNKITNENNFLNNKRNNNNIINNSNTKKNDNHDFIDVSDDVEGYKNASLHPGDFELS